MSNDIDFDALYDGLQVDDLLIKATLRVPARPMKSAVAQSLSVDLKALYKVRLDALMADIHDVLDTEELPAAATAQLVFQNGRALFKAISNAKSPVSAKPEKSPQTVTSSGERKLTPDGYVHVVSPGSRGGKFWRDEKGNIRYGEHPHGTFQIPASPSQVVEHYRKYYAPQPFAAHNQLDLHEALMQSDVMSEADHNFMEFWNDNYDEILSSISNGEITRKDVEKAGGLHNISFKLGGRDVGIQEMIEEFFKTNANLFVGDPTYGDIESTDEVLEAVRGVMDRYRTALHQDPKVQAAAQASAEKRENEKSAFYIAAEHMADEFSPLAGDLVTGEDFEDLTFKATAAMRQMGLIERGSKGGVSQRRMRGAIVPKSSMLLQDKKNLGSLWKDDQLERLSASQLMTLCIAIDAQESFATDNTYDYEPGLPNEMRDKVFDILADKLGISPDDELARNTLKRKLEKTTESTLRAFTKYNTGQDPLFKMAMEKRVGDIYKNSNWFAEHKEAVADEQQRLVEILAAQEDTNFEPSKSMASGVWNGTTLKDPDHPEKGVWAPFDYQKKYVNWMEKVKRGVIAADAGMGKTPMVIAFRERLADKGKDIPAICFLPPSLMEQWPAAVAKFAPEQADKILNLSGLSLEERKVALQSDMAKTAKYIFISTGTLTGEVPDPNVDESENDGTGGSDQEMVKLLQSINGAVFIDEAHQGGYKKASNTRHEIAKAVMQDREYAFGMTATPMPNNPMDVYHLANLFAPGSVGDQELWSGRMAGVTWDDENSRYEVSNPEHLAELNQRLKPYVFYKSINDPDVIADIGKALPQKTGVHTDTTLHEGEGDLELSKHVNSENGLSQHDYFKEGGVIDTMVELRIGRLVRDRTEKMDAKGVDPKTGESYEPYDERTLSLMAGGMKVMLQRQASISPALIDHTFRKSDGGVAHSPKIKAVCDDLIAHFSNGGQGGDDAKPAVVFCSFPQKAFPIVRKALAERGVDPSLIETIAGDVHPTERGYMQDKLNKGHAKVLLVGTKSGGAGLNLQEAANKTLFLDEPWDPATKRQASGRVMRTGQKNIVHEKTYRSVGTYDSVVEQKIAGKQAMVAALLGKEAPTSTMFDPDTSVRELLGRVKGSNFTEDQIRAIMENSKNYDMASSEHKQAEMLLQNMHDDDWSEQAGSRGFGGGLSAKLKDDDFKPNEKAQQTLKRKGAGKLTVAFDDKEFRAKWEIDRNQRRAKQDFEIANLMAGVYKQKGDVDKAEQYEHKIEALKEKYPELGENTDAQKPEKKKPTDAKQRVQAKEDAKAEKKAELDKKPPRATATVADAEAELKQAQNKPSAKTGGSPLDKFKPKPEMKAHVTKNKDANAPTNAVEPTKVVKEHKVLGIQMHTTKNPFNESDRKVKGTDVTHAEANFVFDLLNKKNYSSWYEFMTNYVAPVWDDEGGRNPFSLKVANVYIGKIVDAIADQGAITLKPSSLRPHPEAKKANVKKSLDFDLAKAQRADPYGHVAYTRHSKTGKLVQVKQKGVKPQDLNQDSPYLVHPDKVPFHPEDDENDHKIWHAANKAKPQTYDETVQAIHGAIKKHFKEDDKDFTDSVVQHFQENGAMHPADHEPDLSAEEDTDGPGDYFSFDHAKHEADVNHAKEHAKEEALSRARGAVYDAHGVNKFDASVDRSYRTQGQKPWGGFKIDEAVHQKADEAELNAHEEAYQAGERAAARVRENAHDDIAEKAHANQMLKQGLVGFSKVDPSSADHALEDLTDTFKESMARISSVATRAAIELGALKSVEDVLNDEPESDDYSFESSDLSDPSDLLSDVADLIETADDAGITVPGIDPNGTSYSDPPELNDLPELGELPEEDSEGYQEKFDAQQAVVEQRAKVLHKLREEKATKAHEALEKLHELLKTSAIALKEKNAAVNTEVKAISKKYNAALEDDDQSKMFINRDMFPEGKEEDDFLTDDQEMNDDGETKYKDPAKQEMYENAKSASSTIASHIDKIVEGGDRPDPKDSISGMNSAAKSVADVLKTVSKLVKKKKSKGKKE